MSERRQLVRSVRGEQIAIKKEAPEDDRYLRVTWRHGEHHASLYADLETCGFEVIASGIKDAGQTSQTR